MVGSKFCSNLEFKLRSVSILPEHLFQSDWCLYSLSNFIKKQPKSLWLGNIWPHNVLISLVIEVLAHPVRTDLLKVKEVSDVHDHLFSQTAVESHLCEAWPDL